MSDLTLAQVLAELPDTADGIADRMRALGIKGKRGRSCCCPLANYLVSEGFDQAIVGESWIEVLYDSGSVECDTPPVIAEFIDRFDAGVYLDLVEVAS